MKNTFFWTSAKQDLFWYLVQPPYSTQLIVRRLTCSPLETKRSYKATNSENTEDVAAVRSIIRSVWSWRR